MLFERFRNPRAPFFLLLVVLLFLSLQGVSLGADFSPAMIRRVSPAVKLLVTEDSRGNVGQGTGFFVSPEGHMLTNYHVVEGSRKAAIVEDKKVHMVTRIIAFDRNADVALVMTEYPKARVQHLPLRRSMVELGESIMVLGYPQALQLGTAITLTKGNVSSIRPAGANTLVQFTAAVAGGSSGSPIIDKNGEVAGIVTSELKLGQSMFLGLSSPSISRHVGRHLSTGRAAVSPPRPQTPPRPITPPSPPKPTPTPAVVSTPATAQEIREAQAILNELGFNAGSVDGKAGPQTETAVKVFQRNRGVAQDGKLTKSVLEMLRSVKRERETPARPAPASREAVHYRAHRRHLTQAINAAFSPDGRYVYTVTTEGVQIWDLTSRRIVNSFSFPKSKFSWGLTISASSNRNVLIQTELWDATTGTLIRTFPGTHGVFSNENTVLTVDREGLARYWNASTGNLIRTLHGVKLLSPLAMTPDRDRFFRTVDGNPVLVDISSGREIRYFYGHGGTWGTTLAISPDGRILLGGSFLGNNLVKLWDIPTGKVVGEFSVDSGFRSASFSPDGGSILTVSRSRSVDIWRLVERR